MMFPTSYPYSTNAGWSITSQELSDLADKLLTSNKPLSENFGLELAYIMLWALDRAETKTNFVSLTTGLFFRALKQRRDLAGAVPNYITLEEIELLCINSINLENILLTQMDTESIIGDEVEVTRIASMRKRDRDRKIQELKEKWESL